MVFSEKKRPSFAGRKFRSNLLRQTPQLTSLDPIILSSRPHNTHSYSTVQSALTPLIFTPSLQAFKTLLYSATLNIYNPPTPNPPTPLHPQSAPAILILGSAFGVQGMRKNICRMLDCAIVATGVLRIGGKNRLGAVMD